MIALRHLAGLALFLAACFSPLDNPDPTERCASHHTLESCLADDSCSPANCPACDTTTSFEGCYPGGKAPQSACPELKCAPPCSEISDETTCQEAPGCLPLFCTACAGESKYSRCYAAEGAPPPVCEEPACPTGCAAHTTEAACTADATCFPVYEDPGTCDCAGIGCCMVFTRCDQGPADCATTPTCSFAPIVCGTGYMTIVENGCVTGCAPTTYCAAGA